MPEKSMHEMTITELRSKGYAVVVFTPEELRGADPKPVQDTLVETGWVAIDSIASC